jgi:hypothetical protein
LLVPMLMMMLPLLSMLSSLRLKHWQAALMTTSTHQPLATLVMALMLLATLVMALMVLATLVMVLVLAESTPSILTVVAPTRRRRVNAKVKTRRRSLQEQPQRAPKRRWMR